MEQVACFNYIQQPISFFKGTDYFYKFQRTQQPPFDTENQIDLPFQLNEADIAKVIAVFSDLIRQQIHSEDMEKLSQQEAVSILQVLSPLEKELEVIRQMFVHSESIDESEIMTTMLDFVNVTVDFYNAITLKSINPDSQEVHEAFIEKIRQEIKDEKPARVNSIDELFA
jgi:hypothetical protein